jgi:hypothetical protein
MDRYSGREVLKPEKKKKKDREETDRRKRRRRKLKKKVKVSKVWTVEENSQENVWRRTSQMEKSLKIRTCRWGCVWRKNR